MIVSVYLFFQLQNIYMRGPIRHLIIVDKIVYKTLPHLPFTVSFVPETKGQSVGAREKNFGATKGSRKFTRICERAPALGLPILCNILSSRSFFLAGYNLWLEVNLRGRGVGGECLLRKEG